MANSIKENYISPEQLKTAVTNIRNYINNSLQNFNPETGEGGSGSVDTTYVDNAIANLVNSAPSTLDTLKELADALGNDANFATTVTEQIGSKANGSDVLTKINTTEYIPTEDYHPSTKKYVDDKFDSIEIPTDYLTSQDIINKVDKDGDKVLSTNDYTDEDKDKLDNIIYLPCTIDEESTETYKVYKCEISSLDRLVSYKLKKEQRDINTRIKFYYNDKDVSFNLENFMVNNIIIGGEMEGYFSLIEDGVEGCKGYMFTETETNWQIQAVTSTTPYIRNISQFIIDHNPMNQNYYVNLFTIQSNRDFIHTFVNDESYDLSFGFDGDYILDTEEDSIFEYTLGYNILTIMEDWNEDEGYSCFIVSDGYKKYIFNPQTKIVTKEYFVSNKELESKADKVHEHTQYLTEQNLTDYATTDYVDNLIGGIRIVQITQTDYDNLENKDPNTLYVIVDQV